MRDMPAVIILCGGLGLRLRTTPDAPPKALTPVGGRPVLWHLMKIYSHWGVRRFILALGHRGDDIVEWFARRTRAGRDLTYRLDAPDALVLHPAVDESRRADSLDDDERTWTVTFAHTGEHTSTGGRLRRAAAYLEEDRAFVTYADGLSDVSIPDVLARHRDSADDATLVAVRAPMAFGELRHEEGRVLAFHEKPDGRCCINGGFFVVERHVLDAITGDAAVFEEDVLPNLASRGTLGAWPHDGFWRCLDTPKDARDLTALWETGRAPWKLWTDP